MSEYIDRYDRFGKSIANDIFFGVENETIRLVATEVSDGRRLDHYAQKYYGNGMNSWIIAAASGIRWPLGVGVGSANREESDGIVLFIPNIEDIKRLKRR